MSDSDSSSGKKSPAGSAANFLLSVGSFGAGAYHGFCDAQDIPLPRENLEFALTWGPTIVRGTNGVLAGGLVGLVGGAAAGGSAGGAHSDRVSDVVAGAGLGAAGGAVVGAGVFGTIGAVVGGVQTLLGYGLGYVSGAVLK